MESTDRRVIVFSAAVTQSCSSHLSSVGLASPQLSTPILQRRGHAAGEMRLQSPLPMWPPALMPPAG